MSYTCVVPRVDISTPLGDITTGASPRFKPVNVSWSASIFGAGGAFIDGVEYASGGKYMNSRDFGGLWVIACGGQSYYYMMDGQGSAHLQGRSFRLVDLTSQWDVLLTQEDVTSAKLTAAGFASTVGGLINYLAKRAESISSIGLRQSVTNTTLLTDVMQGDTDAEKNTYSISNSTYLAELNKLLSWFGYVCYADPSPLVPGAPKIAIIAPVEDSPFDSLTVNPLAVIDAQYDIDYGSIHSDVVVSSNETNKGAVCGKAVQVESAMQSINTTNYDVSKRFNPLFATTFKVVDTELLNVAKKILHTDLVGAQTLKLTLAGAMAAKLWHGFNWVDKNNQIGHWVTTGYTIEVSGSAATTTLDCILGPAVNIPGSGGSVEDYSE